MNKKLLIGIAILIVVVLAGLFLAKQQGWIGKEESIEVVFAKVKRSDIIEKVSASGKVRPEIEVKISPDVSGEVIEMRVAEGDSVTKGQLLARIRPDNYRAMVDRSVAAVSTARANFQQSQARIAQSKAQLARAKIEFDRNQKLIDQKVIADAEFTQFKLNFDVAEQELQANMQNMEAARFSVKSAEASLKDATDNLLKTEIYAPMSGVISKLSIEKGERVVGTSQMAGTEMMRIANLQNMEVLVDVNENDIRKLAIKDSAEIEVDAYTSLKRKFKGVVTAIANTAKTTTNADAVTEFEVRIHILNDSYNDLVDHKTRLSPFRPGMTASVEVITDRKTGVLAAPLSAVTMRRDKKESTPAPDKTNPEPASGSEDDKHSRKEIMKEVVFVHDTAGKARQVEVTTGVSDFDNIEILSGLAEGTEIIAGPFIVVSKQLNDGSRVRKSEPNKGSKWGKPGMPPPPAP